MGEFQAFPGSVIQGLFAVEGKADNDFEIGSAGFFICPRNDNVIQLYFRGVSVELRENFPRTARSRFAITSWSRLVTATK